MRPVHNCVMSDHGLFVKITFKYTACIVFILNLFTLCKVLKCLWIILCIVCCDPKFGVYFRTAKLEIASLCGVSLMLWGIDYGYPDL